MDRELNVILKLTGTEDGARKTAAYADANKRAASAVDGLTEAERRMQQQQKQMQQTGSAPQQRFAGVVQHGAANQFSDYRMNPAAYNGGGNGGASQGGGIPGPLKAILGLSAGASAIRGVGGGLGAVAGMDASTNFSQAFSAFTGQMLEGVPIIGQLTRGIGDAASALSGLTSTVEANKRSLTTSGRMLATERSIGSARYSADQEIISAGAPRRNALAGQLAGEAAMRRLPGALAGFRAQDEFGNYDAALGGANAGVFAAQTAVDLARRQAQARRDELGMSDQLSAGLDGRIADQRGVATRAAQQAAAAERALAGQGYFFNAAGSEGKSKSDLEGAVSTAQTNKAEQEARLADLLAKKQDDLNASKERQNAIAQANANIAQKELDLAKAQAQVEQTRVAKLDEQIGRSKSGAAALGMGLPGESDSLLATVRQLKEQGIGSLTPEQKSQLAGNDLTAGLLRQKAQEAGMSDPNFAAIRSEVGGADARFALPDLSQLEAERNQIVDTLAQKLLESETKFQEASAKVLGDSFDKIADAILKAFEAKAEEIRVRIQSDISKGAVQGRT